MLLDITQEEKQIYVSYFDESGDVKFKIYDLKPNDLYNWEICEPFDKKASIKYKNWNGKSVKKYKSNFLTKFRLIEYLHDLSDEDKEIIFNYNYPKLYFVDIEVDVIDGFPDPNKADTAITTISILMPDNNCIVFATKDLSYKEQLDIQNKINEYFKNIDEKFNFHFKVFNSEYDMIYTFLDKIVKKASLITGWNFIQFDWTYIVNRSHKLGIDINISSPINRVFGKNNIPCHVGMMDYLEIYSRWDRSVDIKENYKLDTVADVVTGFKKIKYNGSIQDMYNNDYKKYVFYNVVDTILVYLIHKKIETIYIALTVAHLSKISIFKAGSPVAVTESLLCREYYINNLVIAKQDLINKKEAYEGAYVKTPIIDMHHYVASFDFASLYPSVMRQLNISPESYLCKIDPNSKDKEKYKNDIVSVTGTVFSSEKSILKTILTNLYSLRKEYKNKYKEYSQKIYDLNH